MWFGKWWRNKSIGVRVGSGISGAGDEHLGVVKRLDSKTEG